LSAIHAIFDPGAAPLARLVVAVLLFAADSFKALLADCSQQVPWRSLDVIRNPDSLVLDNKKTFQERSTFDQRKACQITLHPAQQIEDVVVNSSCFRPEIL
jgi:hypothetical protein